LYETLADITNVVLMVAIGFFVGFMTAKSKYKKESEAEKD